MIDIKNLYLSFTKEFDALHDISLHVAEGEKIALVGDTDSGKTMLLRVLAGLEKFGSGSVTIKNYDIKKIDFKQDISVGFVPKNFVFMDKKTVRENLEYVLKLRNIEMATINFKILTALKYYGIETIENMRIKDLSAYQKTLVQIARVSMRKVDLFLIDDITANLTDSEKFDVTNKLKTLLENNPTSTFIIASSSAELAQKLNLKSIKLRYGCIVND